MKKSILILTLTIMCFTFVFGYNKGYFGITTEEISGLLPDLTLDELTETSDLIVQGQLVDISSPYKIETSSGETSIFTDYIIQPYKILRGTLESDNIKIRMQGGRIGNREVIVSENPQMSIGDEAIFFLWQPNIGGGFNTAENDYYYLSNNHYGVYYKTGKNANFENEMGESLDLNTFTDLLTEVAAIDPERHKKSCIDGLQSNLKEGFITQEEYDRMIDSMNNYAHVIS